MHYPHRATAPFLVLLLAVFFTACQKDDDLAPTTDLDSTPITVPDDAPLGALIDGTLFLAETPTALLFPDYLAIYGSGTEQKAINFFLDRDIEPGTYSITYFGKVTGGYAPNVRSVWPASRGTLTVATHDQDGQRITGTLSFRADNPEDTQQSVEVTSGRFDLEY